MQSAHHAVASVPSSATQLAHPVWAHCRLRERLRTSIFIVGLARSSLMDQLADPHPTITFGRELIIWRVIAASIPV